MSHFRLRDDVHVDGRWYLGDVRAIDNWSLVSGSTLSSLPQSFAVEIDQDGNEMDFTLTEAFGVPIVSGKLKDALAHLTSVRFVPVTLSGRKTSSPYFVMLIESLVECVDEARSEFEQFGPDDPVRPDLAGQFKAFYELILDGKKAAAADPMFRLARFPSAIIVSEAVKRIFERVGATGAIMQGV